MRPWSFSRLTCAESCPAAYSYQYIQKIKMPYVPAPAAERGTKIHKEAEDYLLGKVHIYPPSLQKVAGHAMALKAKGAKPEGQVAVDATWKPCDYESPDAYFRGIIDIMYREEHILHIEDWKSGQVYPDHADQMETYVGVGAAYYPDCTTFETRLIYLDQGTVTPPKLTSLERVKPIRMMLDARIGNIEALTEFPPTPSRNACRWCDYHKKNGGPCDAGV